MTQGFHDLTLAAVVPQESDAVSLVFDVPESLRETFRFTPGQYLTLKADIDGEDVRRSYSICSGLSEPGLAVGIRRLEGGAFSNHALSLKVGDTVEVMPPQGRFTAEIGGAHNYLLVAAGSGITPCLSIAKSVLELEPESRITLVYGNSRIATTMFRTEVDALKDRYTDRFQLIHTMSRERVDAEFLNGRVDGAMIERLVERRLFRIDEFDAAYVCGPQPMIESTAEALQRLGMAQEKIRFELFTTEGFQDRAPAKPTVDAKSGAEVTITLDGGEKRITVDGERETVLAAAQAAGLDLPFSCAGGMCCTCRCKVTEGQAAMDKNYSLQNWEVDAGFVLACQSRPLTDKLALDFDAA